MITGAGHPLDIGRPTPSVTSVTPSVAAARAMANGASAAASATCCAATLHVPSLNVLRFRFMFKEIRQQFGYLVRYTPSPCSSTSRVSPHTDGRVPTSSLVNGESSNLIQDNRIQCNDSSLVKRQRYSNDSATIQQQHSNDKTTKQPPITGHQTTVRSMLSNNELTARIKLRSRARKALFNCIWGIAHNLALGGSWTFRLDVKYLQGQTKLARHGVHSGIRQFIKDGILCKHPDGMFSWGLPFKNQALGDDDISVF